MASVKNMLKGLNKNSLLVLVVVAALGYALYTYSQNKKYQVMAPTPNAGTEQENFRASHPEGENGGPAPVHGVKTTQDGLPSGCSKKSVVDPAQLLPKNVKDNEFAKLNPKGAGSLEGVNLLTAGYQIGINTIGTSLRNANLQVRSEPANPQVDVSPWNQSTITADLMRKPLEIGCGPKVCDR